MKNNKKEVIDEIMKIISSNNLTILEAKEILRITSKKLDNQKVEGITLSEGEPDSTIFRTASSVLELR